MKIKVPASTSNLGPGFDTLGLALNRYLFIDVEPTKEKRLAIDVDGNGKDHIARDESNLVYQGMCALASHTGKSLPGLRLRLQNDIPAYGGLGGSGAAIAGGVFTANQLLETKLSVEEMLGVAVSVEGHPDNVSAALMGGLTINCFENGIVRCRTVKVRFPISIVTCSPHFWVLTKQARQILPKEIPLKDAVTEIENVASLVAALMEGDVDALRYATNDRMHEPYRAELIPGFDDVKRAALEAGAISFNISGAGPTVFCFANRNEKEIGSAMVKAFAAHGKAATCEVMTVENNGAAVVQ
jgi:homoserine kinase